ncbi:Asp23/Gls24 family envelope stress response protein [Streptomyces sp. TR06-5]|uniref:Asp23/Gls24 family envelope stress response protein n=1 Tax=Streptomyces sp. TR06-5 TaxID=3385976 RepID=UPI0039A27EF0
MTNTVSARDGSKSSSAGSAAERKGDGGRHSGAVDGGTTIADGVVAKIAGMAAREVPGVHAMGGGFARSMGAMRERVPGGGGRPPESGVKVEVGQKQVAVDLRLVVEYDVAIPDVAGEVRESVTSAVERMTGREVVEVGIVVDDVHLPGEEDEADEESGDGRRRVE